MNLELHNVKVCPDMSRETTAFTASLVLGGSVVGFVRNDGGGGCHSYHWLDRRAEAELRAWATKLRLEFDFEHLDQVVDGLLAKGAVIQ